MKNAVAFVGPSFAGTVSQDIFPENVIIRPPVRRGDLSMLTPSISTVLIIDGVFHSALAVSAREIMEILAKGVSVYGSSSMGALRAAELDSLGMIGIGKVYRMYKSGEAESDAEVALIFDEESLMPLSEPLVNIRHAVSKAIKHGQLPRTEGQNIIAIAKTFHYYDLTFENLFKRLNLLINPQILSPFMEFVESNQSDMDLKRLDAIELAKNYKMTCMKSDFVGEKR